MDPRAFVPPRCPNRSCDRHRQPVPDFFRRAGSYRPSCRTHPVPRFECRSCGRGFSFQTFRLDYRDRRPDLNLALLERLVGGATLRHCARSLRADCKTVQRKFRKIARHLRLLDRNLLRRLPPHLVLCLDEQEDFEATRTKPVTIPIVVDQLSKLIVVSDVAPIRRAGSRGSAARRKLDRQEALEGRRQDRGRSCIRRLFGRLERLLGGQAAELVTDSKTSYASEHRRRFGSRVVHRRISSVVPKSVSSPLFPIHLTQAMVRCSNARMRRRSWAKSKRHSALKLQLAIFGVFRNWHRQRHNSDPWHFTPAVSLGLTTRRIELVELLAWRQDWRTRSIHPQCPDGARAILEHCA